MRELGIRALSCSARLALRILVSMSAIGSANTSSFPLPLPRALGHPRDHALVRELAQADPAQPELAVDGAWAPAAVAAVVRAHREPLGPPRLDDHGLLRHRSLGLPSLL